MIDDFDVSSSSIRLLVFEALKTWPSTGLVNFLLDNDCIVRTAAAREIQARNTREIFDQVVSLVKHKESYVREIAVFTLGQFGTPHMLYREETIPLLMNSLRTDDSSDVRAAAAAGLGHLCYDGMENYVIDELVVSAGDCDPEVRSCTAFALGQAKNNSRALLALERLSSDTSEQVRSYARLGLDLITGNESSISYTPRSSE